MSDVHGAVGSYVVNALDAREKDDFEAHLTGCETCRREVVEFSETAAQLGSLVEAAPPPELRASILSAIREVRPLPPEEQQGAAARPQLTAPLPAEVSIPATGGAVAVDWSGAVDELAARRARGPSKLMALAVAAALVVALGLGGWVANLRQDRQAQTAEATLETQLMTAPDVKYYRDTMKNGAPVTFVVSKTLNKALLIGRDLPSPGSNRDYQLWTLNLGGGHVAATPDATFDGGQARKTWFTGNLTNADGVAVTVEPDGGSPSPNVKTTQVSVKLS